MWRNEMEIEEIGLGILPNPRLTPWYLILVQWVNIVNSHSDGWAYWKAGANAGEMLSDLLARAAGRACTREQREAYWNGERWEPTDAELRASTRGMRSLVTKRINQGKSPIPLPAGLARVDAPKLAPKREPLIEVVDVTHRTLQAALF